MKWSALVSIAAVAASALLAAACVSEYDEATGDSTSRQLANPDYLWTSLVVPVCWTNPEDSEAMAWVQSAVESTWAAKSKVQFRWGPCPTADQSAVRIRIEDSDKAPWSYFGTNVGTNAVTMSLNFSFNKIFTFCKDGREACIRNSAIHEFGHVLGFDHEQNRGDLADVAGACKRDVKGAQPGFVSIGAYDPDSVMNYCAAIATDSLRVASLSQGDIEALQKYYGARSGPAPVSASLPKSKPDVCGRLVAGQELRRDNALVSCDGLFSARVEKSGSLVIYERTKPIWTTGTDGSGATTASFLESGNLVLTAGPVAGKVLWQTSTPGTPAATLEMQNDGSLVLLDGSRAKRWWTLR